MFTPEDRDTFYTACAQGINSAGKTREALFLARLALLLAEQVGDIARCQQAVKDALHELPEPTLSKGS